MSISPLENSVAPEQELTFQGRVITSEVPDTEIKCLPKLVDSEVSEKLKELDKKPAKFAPGTLIGYVSHPAGINKKGQRLVRREFNHKPGTIIRDRAGKKSYIVWKDGSLRRVRTVLKRQMERLLEQAKRGDAEAKAKLESMFPNSTKQIPDAIRVPVEDL